MRNFLYFVGAGLSRALQRVGKPIPVMKDFVSVLAEYMGADPDNVILTTLAELERAGLYDWPSPEAEQLADKLVKQGKNPEPTDVARFRQALRNRPFESIEKLLEKSRSASGRSAESARTRFNYAINRLFCMLGWDVEWLPLKQFLKRQFELADSVHRFVSFNYDLILDHAVQEAGRTDWGPATGYGFKIPYWTVGERPDYQARHLSTLVTRCERILIAKPNGSLNWLAPLSLPYSSGPSGHTVADQGWVIVPLDPDGKVSYFHSTETSNWVSLPDEQSGGDVWPCILPPTLAKASGLSFLRQARECEERAIAEADEVYVIGWSMPESDADQLCLIRSAVGKRGKPLTHLTIVNWGGEPEYFRRIADVFGFPQSRMQIFNGGFCEFATGSCGPRSADV